MAEWQFLRYRNNRLPLNDSEAKMTKKLPNIHPGEILLEEFLKPMEISQNKLAHALKVPPRRINEIVLRKRRITADTAVRFGKYFNIEPSWWLNLQNLYDVEEVNKKKQLVYSEIHSYKKAG